MRGVVAGHKNNCGSESRRGTEAAAIFIYLFKAAKLSGVDGAVTLPSDLT
jgi:hypothetical protein